MKLRYFANILLPTEKAHGIQIMEMCQAFQNEGHIVDLYVAKRHQTNKNITECDPFTYYGIKTKFPIHYLPVIDLLFLHLPKQAGDLAFFMTQICFTFHSLFIKVDPADMVYTREKLIVLVFYLTRKTFYLVYEAHDSGRSTWLDRFIAKHSTNIVTISKSIEQSWQMLGAKTVYAPDGVSNEFFINKTKSECRDNLSLPLDQKILVYTGNIFAWKGINTPLEASRTLSHCHFYIVGGEGERDFVSLKEKYLTATNIHFVGNRPHNEIPLWLKAADLLVIPNSAKTKKGREDTSPLKLFEYLASGTLILASRVPAITEIVSEDQVIFFEPDDIHSYTSEIETIMSQAVEKSVSNKEFAEQFTWEKRAQLIFKKVRGRI